jgi:hypothetical protein
MHQFYFPNQFIDDPLSDSILDKIRAGESKFHIKRNIQMFACKQCELVKPARSQLTIRRSGGGNLPNSKWLMGDGCASDQGL